ncbi:MAG: patatin-like phospholipase family protein [Betaproteobacteria bacterium]|nr:patatin-like phospholipase family protein [Betaproteobacteria bacterium]
MFARSEFLPESPVIVIALRRFVVATLVLLTAAGCASRPARDQVTPGVAEPLPGVVEQVPALPPEIVVPPPRLGLVLGGGAARGFAHVGVIKMLEAQGLKPDIIVGTSAGSVVGALYAAGYSGFDLQRLALALDEKAVSDWALPNRGFLKGEALQAYVDNAVKGRPIEQLPRVLGIVATDLHSGEQVVFRQGDTGLAVRASSCVPGVFQPVTINGREYVDGGLTSPVPVKAARDLGADIVIAVDISKNPVRAKVRDTIEVLLQTFTIMGRAIAAQEMRDADVVIAPGTDELASASFESRNLASLEGEKAALAAIPKIRTKIAEREQRLRNAAIAARTR